MNSAGRRNACSRRPFPYSRVNSSTPKDGEVLVGLPLSLMLMTAGVRCFGLEFKVSTIDLPRRTVVYVRR
jgi:hypothetical protein